MGRSSLIISAPGSLRQEDCFDFKASLGCIVSTSQKKKNQELNQDKTQTSALTFQDWLSRNTWSSAPTGPSGILFKTVGARVCMGVHMCASAHACVDACECACVDQKSSSGVILQVLPTFLVLFFFLKID